MKLTMIFPFTVICSVVLNICYLISGWSLSYHLRVIEGIILFKLNKAYSSVIADAAEDSEPAHPVIYTEVMEDFKHEDRMSHAPAYWYATWFLLSDEKYLRPKIKSCLNCF